MAVKLIRCPSCGEEIEITDLYEGVEIECSLCNSVMVYQEGRLLLLDTNEEFDIDELESIEEEEEEFEDEFEEEEDYYYDEEY
jgi:DNA-directed RNA polymerase subunit RPC12/RpoP